MANNMKIIFTSCARYDAFPQQPQWQKIEAENPDYLFLLGDQIYMDFGLPFFSKEPNGSPKKYSPAEFRRRMNEKYQRQWSEPHFKRLIEKMQKKNALFGVWDDHDFAWDNAFGNAVPAEIKAISRELFHQWMNCSTNKPEVYCHVDTPFARVIFLDNRSYADPSEKTNRQLLGSAQFTFLAEKLNHDKQYTILCSGLTLTQGIDNWEKYPEDYQQLKTLLAGRKNVLFLGGDIHKNAFLAPDSRRPCHEIIASGIAVNYLGLPLRCDNRTNWGMLVLNAEGVEVSLIGHKGTEQHHIAAQPQRTSEATSSKTTSTNNSASMVS